MQADVEALKELKPIHLQMTNELDDIKGRTVAGEILELQRKNADLVKALRRTEQECASQKAVIDR